MEICLKSSCFYIGYYISRADNTYFYLKLGPSKKIDRVFLSPFVTGSTLCNKLDLNINIAPGLSNGFQTIH